MISLIFAVLSSFLVSVFMRVGEMKPGSKMGLFSANYTVCSLLGAFFVIKNGFPSEGQPFALGLGLFGGFAFLYSFVLFQKSIAKNGMVLSSTFMKLGVLVPTLIAMLAFGEQPRPVTFIGMALAVLAIVVLNFEKGSSSGVNAKGLLIFLMVVCGGADALTNVYDKMGMPESKDLFLMVIFVTALAIALFLLIRRHERPTGRDILIGIGVGIPNYFSSRFLLASLASVPATVVFPVFSVGTILLVTLAGALIFKEKLTARKIGALAIIVCSLVLLNI